MGSLRGPRAARSRESTKVRARPPRSKRWGERARPSDGGGATRERRHHPLRPAGAMSTAARSKRGGWGCARRLVHFRRCIAKCDPRGNGAWKWGETRRSPMCSRKDRSPWYRCRVLLANVEVVRVSPDRFADSHSRFAQVRKDSRWILHGSPCKMCVTTWSRHPLARLARLARPGTSASICIMALWRYGVMAPLSTVALWRYGVMGLLAPLRYSVMAPHTYGV